MKTKSNTRNKALILTASLLGTMFIHTSGNARETKLVSEEVKKSVPVTKGVKGIAQAAGKIAGPAGALVETGLLLHRRDEKEAEVEKGEITRKEAGKKHAGSIVAVGGGVSGGIGGALGGAKVGGAIGTAICPWIGPVGGGMFEDTDGKWIGEKAAASSKNIRDAVNWSGRKMNNACDSVTETATAAGNQIKRSSRAASREIQKGWTSVKNCFTSPILVTPAPILIDDSIRSDDTDGLIGLTESAGKWIGEKAAESSKKIRNATTSTGRKINNAYDSVTETATAAGNQIKRSSRAASREIQKGWTSVKNCFSW
jgi:hypothetical protein